MERWLVPLKNKMLTRTSPLYSSRNSTLVSVIWESRGEMSHMPRPSPGRSVIAGGPSTSALYCTATNSQVHLLDHFRLHLAPVHKQHEAIIRSQLLYLPLFPIFHKHLTMNMHVRGTFLFIQRQTLRN